MENNLEVIPIFFAVDDGYIPFLAVALQSLIENSSNNYYYSIKVLYTNIKEENKKRILKYEKENVKIEFVDLNYYIEEIKGKLFTRDYYTKTTYFRLFIPNLYPQYDKIIYLDSDIVLLGDIADLYHQEMENNLVAAVPDDIIQTTEVFQEYVEKVVGVADYRKYFNAGVLLMNLDELRKFHFQEKFLYLLETVKYAVVQDQDYLNRLCKGKTKILPTGWDRMPVPNDKVKEEEIKLIHYNLNYKPWHFDNILYKEYFWEYAQKTEYYDEIKEIKENYTEEERFRDMKQYEDLKILAQKESDCVGDDRLFRRKVEENNSTEAVNKRGILEIIFRGEKKREEPTQDTKKRRLRITCKSRKGDAVKERVETQENRGKYQERLEVLKRIEDMEKRGVFDVDAENDPPTIPLAIDDVDYLNKKSTSKIKSKVANKVGEHFLDNLLKTKKMIIKEVHGIENLKKVETGAILTCNHFNPFDGFAIEEVFRRSGQSENKKLYKVIREGNYTNFPGLYGFFFRNCDTLPLSSSNETMMEFVKAVDTILQREDFILIYPEQSMWWNYRKPKPLKSGAFRFAARNHVPVIPIFITMEDSDVIGEDGFPVQEYIVNVESPIYPDENLTEKENATQMKEKNTEVWKKVYEDFYGVQLEYATEQNEVNQINLKS